jgi:hypothetical protein
MLRRQRYWTLSILLASAVLLGIFLPAYLDNTPRDVSDSFYFTPRPTSTRFKTPMSNVMEVFNTEGEEAPAAAVVEADETNCTYPVVYWQDHPDEWPAEIVIGGVLLNKDAARSVYAAADPDVQTGLIRQVYTAFLNIIHGADMRVMENVLKDAVLWLEANPPGVQLSEFNRRQGLDIVQLVENYNNGYLGPGVCPGAPVTATPSPVIPTLTPSETAVLPTAAFPTQPLLSTPLRLPSPTSSFRQASPQPTLNPTVPTPTLQPTTSTAPTLQPSPTLFPGSPTLAPIQTFPPSPTRLTPTPSRTPLPTLTPPPPTNTPRPTNTPPPPTNTPRPTSTPPPTATMVPPTNTPPPTATPVPPTNTPAPTATPLPTNPPTPTNTPNTPPGPTRRPPTSTPVPSATPVPPT